MLTLFPFWILVLQINSEAFNVFDSCSETTRSLAKTMMHIHPSFLVSFPPPLSSPHSAIPILSIFFTPFLVLSSVHFLLYSLFPCPFSHHILPHPPYSLFVSFPPFLFSYYFLFSFCFTPFPFFPLLSSSPCFFMSTCILLVRFPPLHSFSIIPPPILSPSFL